MDVGIEIAFFYRGIRTPYAGKKHQALQDHRGVLQKNQEATMAYTVGEMAKRLGVPASTLRYYDKEGLLPFVGRSSGGIRAESCIPPLGPVSSRSRLSYVISA